MPAYIKYEKLINSIPPLPRIECPNVNGCKERVSDLVNEKLKQDFETVKAKVTC
jgi:hypothetical protein